ncbi:hypothetical protein [Sphingomonas sp.]|uniref:hypothetical protein n=1 Tax=Sphingomonas sp. TaxID=28214 RepID=UPI003B3BAE47
MILPAGWAKATIGDIIAPIETGAPAERPDVAFRYVDIGSIDNRTQRIAYPKDMLGADAPSRARRRIRSGDVLFSTVRPYLKNIAIVPPELDGEYTSTGICVLRAVEGIDPNFLFKRVMSQEFVDAMTRASDGSLYPAIADNDVFRGDLPLPPAAEQLRIVARLDMLAARLARARGELDRMSTLPEALRRSALDAAFSGALTADLRSDGGGQLAELPKIDDQERGMWRARSLPGEWRWAQFSDFFNDVTDSKRKLPENAYQIAGSYPVIDQGKRQVGGYTDRTDLLHSATSPVIVFGDHTRCVKLVDPPFVQGADGVKVLSPAAGVEVKFARYALLAVQIPAKGYSRHMKFVRKTVWPLPGKAEQRVLVTRLDTIFAHAGRLEAEAARARELLDRLESAILTKAFRGELVPQDPNDEPASVLLDRVRAQRAAKLATKRTRRTTATA